MPLFEVLEQARLPKEAGDDYHHARRSDGRAIFRVGGTVNGDVIEPRTLERLVARGTLAETQASMAEARRLSDAEALRAAAEEHRAKGRKGGVK